MADKTATVRTMILPTMGTLATGFVVYSSLVDLGRARHKYGVKAPETDMPDDAKEEDRQSFKRAYRQWMNLIEWITIAQPIFWVSAFAVREAYGSKSKPFKIVGSLSVLWAFARFGYGKAYQRAADKRAPFFIVSALSVLISLGIGSVAAAKIAKQEFSRK